MNFFKIYVVVALLFLSPTFGLATDLEIRKITPPRLEQNNMGRKILCYRPARHGTPNMSNEMKDGKFIVHNYGHGGSGWTLAPGAVKHVNNEFFMKNSKNIKKNSRITVIGAGALGLFTAYDLLQRGYNNVTVVADQFDNLASNNAGGLVAPVSMDNDEKMQKIVDDIAVEAYKFYSMIALGNNDHFKNGAMILSTYFDTREESGLEPYVGTVMKPAKDVMLDFGNGTTRKMVAYDDGIFVDTHVMMSYLREYLDKNKVKFVKKKINSFSDISDKFIFNCTGLGAKLLNNDANVYPVQGHLIMLKDQVPEDIKNNMILVYLDTGETTSGQKVKYGFYIFPKYAGSVPSDIGVIGGTFIDGAGPDTPNEEQFDIVIKKARDFYGLDKALN